MVLLIPMRIVFQLIVPVLHWTRLHHQLGEEPRMGTAEDKGGSSVRGRFWSLSPGRSSLLVGSVGGGLHTAHVGGMEGGQVHGSVE